MQADNTAFLWLSASHIVGCRIYLGYLLKVVVFLLANSSLFGIPTDEAALLMHQHSRFLGHRRLSILIGYGHLALVGAACAYHFNTSLIQVIISTLVSSLKWKLLLNLFTFLP